MGSLRMYSDWVAEARLGVGGHRKSVLDITPSMGLGQAFIIHPHDQQTRDPGEHFINPAIGWPVEPAYYLRSAPRHHPDRQPSWPLRTGWGNFLYKGRARPF
ncbi:hypothetical protein PAPYR_12581 [Paratrimastix pyriformis]|uniref:Uncharacterized protein n=1 Tax=Paratrimastix pyriformis TaxID=342808 RepID=A0ABQ8U1N2_9EUKA|nr:hypothetical protein PAPYR_12581 [Paratrimastix pyriformis]